MHFRREIRVTAAGHRARSAQGPRVDTVGLGENAQRVGIITRLTRIDQHDRQAGLVERHNQRKLVATRGLDNDPASRSAPQALHEPRDAVGIVGKDLRKGGWEVSQIERLGGDVDAEETLAACFRESRIVHGG